MSYTNNLGNTLPKLNVNTKLPLIPGDFQLHSSQLEAKYMSRLNSSIQLNLPRNSPINSLNHMKSLHVSAPLSHPTTSRQSPYCTPSFPCLHVGTSVPKHDPQTSSASTSTHYCQ